MLMPPVVGYGYFLDAYLCCFLRCMWALDFPGYFVSFLHEVAIGITNSAYRGTRNIYASLRTSYNSAICLIMLPKGSSPYC